MAQLSVATKQASFSFFNDPSSPAAPIVPRPPENGSGENPRIFGFDHPANEPLNQAEASVLEKTTQDAFDKIQNHEMDRVATNPVVVDVSNCWMSHTTMTPDSCSVELTAYLELHR